MMKLRQMKKFKKIIATSVLYLSVACMQTANCQVVNNAERTTENRNVLNGGGITFIDELFQNSYKLYKDIRKSNGVYLDALALNGAGAKPAAIAANGIGLMSLCIADAMYIKLITSASGLIIGMLAYLGYSYLDTQINRTANRMEAASSEFIDILQEPTR